MEGEGTEMKMLAGVIAAMALVIGIVPQFTNCEARGGTMPTMATSSGGGAGAAASATTARPKMKCLWTARAEIGVAVPLFAIGGLLLVSRRKETRRALAVPSALLGVIAMLLPTALIGVCAASGAICRTSLRPSALIAGGVTVVASLALAAVNELRPEPPAEARASA
jgi:hypothetical protein